jgi:hypothetical protein
MEKEPPRVVNDFTLAVIRKEVKLVEECKEKMCTYNALIDLGVMPNRKNMWVKNPKR